MDFLKKINDMQEIINRVRPFEGNLLDQIRGFYRIGLTYSSNALEGNTLTESETKVLLEDGLTVGGKPIRDTYEAIGHARAYDFMFSLLKGDRIEETDIKMLHKLFYEAIESEYAGVYRDIPVIISGSEYPVVKPEQLPEEMNKLCMWILEARNQYHPVEFAALLHKKFVFIHPFKDGNGRVARLLMNTALIQKGYLPVIIPPVLRSEYIAFLERAHKHDRDFILFIEEREYESQKDIIRLLGL